MLMIYFLLPFLIDSMSGVVNQRMPTRTTIDQLFLKLIIIKIRDRK